MTYGSYTETSDDESGGLHADIQSSADALSSIADLVRDRADDARYGHPDEPRAAQTLLDIESNAVTLRRQIDAAVTLTGDVFRPVVRWPSVTDVLDSLSLGHDAENYGAVRGRLDALRKALPAPRPSHIDGRRVLHGLTSPDNRYCLVWCGHQWSMTDAAQGPIYPLCSTCEVADGDLWSLDEGEVAGESLYLVPHTVKQRLWIDAKRAWGARQNRWSKRAYEPGTIPGYAAHMKWRETQGWRAGQAALAPEADVPRHLGAVDWP